MVANIHMYRKMKHYKQAIYDHSKLCAKLSILPLLHMTLDSFVYLQVFLLSPQFEMPVHYVKLKNYRVVPIHTVLMYNI